MTYRNLEGWCNFEDVYDQAVADAQPGDILVEVGVAWGRSLAHLAYAAQRADKGLTVVGVDWWGPAEHARFLEGMRQHAPDVDARIMNMASLAAADTFAPASLGFVFIDASHDYHSVKHDIAAWLPLVRPGGTLAGHDYSEADWPGVVQAVHEAFGPIPAIGEAKYCWAVRA